METSLNIFHKIDKSKDLYLKNNNIFSKTFFGNYNLTSFINSKKINSYKIIHKYPLYIKRKINTFRNGWFLELNLEGLGFKSFFYNNKLILDMGYSNVLEYDFNNLKNINNYSDDLNKKFPIYVFLKGKKIILVSYDKNLIYNFSYFLRSYRKFDSYKLKGLKYKFESIKLKVGKVRV